MANQKAVTVNRNIAADNRLNTADILFIIMFFITVFIRYFLI